MLDDKYRVGVAYCKFAEVLHEKSYFDKNLFLSYMESILKYIEKSKGMSDEDIMCVAFHVFDIYRYCNQSIIAHLDPQDLFIIKEYNYDMNIYIERLEWAIKFLLSRDIDGVINFVDELGAFTT